MLGRDKRSTANEEPIPGGAGTGSVNLISAGTVIEGEINCRGDLRVDGKVIGRITSKSKVVIGTTGEVEGDITCQHADIFGKYSGNMRIAEILFMKSSCHIQGDVHAGKLVVEAGAVFSGHCHMGEAPPSPGDFPKNGKNHDRAIGSEKKAGIPA
ncbi:MAG: polymer-forming cytoskeletal protein [Solitalea sp.]